MRKKLLIAAAGLAVLGFSMLLWRLDIPHWKRLDLSLITHPPGATQVFSESGEMIGTLSGAETRQWVSIDVIPEHVQNAFIAAEDQRFYRHHGVDVYRLFGALWHDLRTLSYGQGGSTITQQLIKLTHLSSAKSLSRKAQEMVLAKQLEGAMDKRQILECYLNIVYFGHGAYGIEAASQVYFSKPCQDLTLSEGALLAGIIKSPSNYAPHLNPDKALARRNSVLSAMSDANLISEAEMTAAQAEALSLNERKNESVKYAWYMDAVLSEAQQALACDADTVLSGGYRIDTGLDPDMQLAAQTLFASGDAFPASAPDGTPVQAALVAVDSASGEIRALVGGRQYQVQRGLNRACQIRRQPGSAIKPLSTYAAAIDAFGYLPSSIIDDTPRTFDGSYAPRNAGERSYGLVTLRQSLSRSLNIATVDLAQTIGINAVQNYARRFALPVDDNDSSLSLALGAMTYGVSPVQLAGGYAALSNGGRFTPPHLIRRITAPDGSILYEASGNSEQAVSPQTAYMLTDMLKTAASSGSARALSACGMPVAGKTGTASDADGGTRDIWTAAFTPELALCVWMGFDDPDARHALPASEGGSGYPARLCAAFLKACAPLLSQRDFSRPDGIRAVLLDAVALENDHVSLLSTERTPAACTVTELFHSYDAPRRFSANWETPRAITDPKILSGPGEAPVLAFTALEDHAEYLLLRTSRDETRQIAVLRGQAGQEIHYADTGHDLDWPADYVVLPRNALLYENGTALTGPPSSPVRYVPGGVLNAVMGVGAQAAPNDVPKTGASRERSLFE